jgi:aminopeptidase N
MKQDLDHDYLFDITRRGFEFFEKTFNTPYPFEKYDQIMAPDFNAGAMENAGAVTLNEVYVFRGAVSDYLKERRVVTVLHELAHMWFGDMVTMRWWNDLWLNESFAEYTSILATAEATHWDESWTTFASGEKAWAYRADQLTTTHPIVAEINDLEDVMINFDGITYAKGASVLKQLAAWVGREAFTSGVAEYFKKHAFKNAVLSDLLVELEKSSGRDLKAWSKQWLETSGVNKLELDLATSPTGEITDFNILQSGAGDQPVLRDHRIAVGFYNLVDGKIKRTDRVELDISGAKTQVDELVGKVRPDLILLNDDDLAFAKIRLDQQSWDFAINNLDKFENSLARTLIWMTAWDMMRDAESPASEYIDLILNNIQYETQGSARLTLFRQLVTTSAYYINTDKLDATWAKISKKLWEHAEAAEPGSDAQYLYLRYWALWARDEYADIMEDLISGKKTLPGREIDQDLRWWLICSLVGVGRRTESDIDTELAKDKTATGQKMAFHARGNFQTLEKRQAFWNTLTTDTSLSNTLIQEGCIAMQEIWDASLMEPFVDQYFELVPKIWETRTFHIAEYFIELLYPTALASDELVARTKEFIAKPEISSKPALKRILSENLDNVQRALKIRKVEQ